MSSLAIAIIAGLGVMFCWGFADFFAKKTIDQIGDVVTLVWGHIFGTTAIVILAIGLFVQHYHTITIPADWHTWLGVAFFGALQAVVYLLVYRAFGKGQLALLNPIFSTYGGVVALVSILVFGEMVHISIVLGLLTIFIGIMLLNLDPHAFRQGRIRFSKLPGFVEILCATVLAAFWTMGWDRFVAGKDWLSYASYMYLFMSIALLLYIGVRKISLLGVTSNLWKYLILIGLFEATGFVVVSWGFGVTMHTSVVALLSSAFSLPTIFLARTFLKEKTTRLQTIGSLVIIAGVILLFVL